MSWLVVVAVLVAGLAALERMMAPAPEEHGSRRDRHDRCDLCGPQ